MLRAFGLVVVLTLGGCAGKESDAGNALSDAGAPSLKLWMSSNASPALKSSNFEKLEDVFENVTAFAPQRQEFATWNAIAAKGAAAATKHDIEGVRHACQSCHSTHRSLYRNTMRGR